MAAKQNVKRRIVDAAWELFYEKGYDDTTIENMLVHMRELRPFNDLEQQRFSA